MMPLLEAQDVSKHFGGVKALAGVSLFVDQGEIVGLIGPNGSGKTTLFNCLTGVLRPDGGIIAFGGRSLIGLKPYRIIQQGIARTFQLTRVFAELTVLQNLLLAQPHAGESLVTAVFHRSAPKVEARAQELLALVQLSRWAHEPAGELSYGQQKLLEFAMAVMPGPDLVLFDEPTAGVNPTLIQQLIGLVRKSNEQGTTFLLIEHNLDVVMALSHRVYVLAGGGKIAEGRPAEIQANPEVAEAYFGE
jgi:ABC-type branched-subunit amino acid transport system ATPase component